MNIERLRKKQVQVANHAAAWQAIRDDIERHLNAAMHSIEKCLPEVTGLRLDIHREPLSISPHKADWAIREQPLLTVTVANVRDVCVELSLLPCSVAKITDGLQYRFDQEVGQKRYTVVLNRPTPGVPIRLRRRSYLRHLWWSVPPGSTDLQSAVVDALEERPARSDFSLDPPSDAWRWVLAAIFVLLALAALTYLSQ